MDENMMGVTVAGDAEASKTPCTELGEAVEADRVRRANLAFDRRSWLDLG